MDKALRASDELEKALVMRIEHEYGKETLKAVGDLKGFFRDVEALEQKKPPAWMDEAAQKRWKRRELDALVQKHRVESRVMKAIRTAGVIAAPLIWGFLAQVYGENASQTVEEAQKAHPQQSTAQRTEQYPQEPAQNTISRQAEPAQSTALQQPQQNFVPQQQREIEILLHDQQPPFGKIAFDNLQQAPALERRLRAEMRQAIINGEGQDKIRQRIQRVMQNGAYNARRIAQTERTRIQSQARWDGMRNAAAQGIPMEKMWIARMKNTRDSHADLNRRTAEVNESFTTIWGNELMYPGDPSAPAREVINCHCVIRPIFGGGSPVLPQLPESVTITENTNETEKNGVRYVGRLDKRMYRAITEDIVGDSVIITDERIAHSNLHKNAFDKYGKYAGKVLSDPDFIIRDKRPKSAVLFRSIQEEDRTIQLVLRLHVSDDNPEYHNSIISYWDIGESRRDNYERNGDIIYRRGEL